jgi:hypothetical protein
MYANFDVFISAKELIKAAFTFELVCFSNSAISFSVNAFNCNSATNFAVAINTSGFSDGDILYAAAGGGLTSTRPATGSGAIGIVAYAASDGIIIVEAKGNGTWGALKAGLA